jgi:hypothetical protein
MNLTPMARLGKGWCLNVPPNQQQAGAQDSLIVWGPQGCNPAIAPDVSNQWFTFKDNHILTGVAGDSELLAACKPDWSDTCEPNSVPRVCAADFDRREAAASPPTPASRPPATGPSPWGGASRGW